MSKNKMSDVRDHLVAMMETLNDESLDEAAAVGAVNKAKALQGLAAAYTENVRLEFQAAKFMVESGVKVETMPVALKPALEHKP